MRPANPVLSLRVVPVVCPECLPERAVSAVLVLLSRGRFVRRIIFKRGTSYSSSRHFARLLRSESQKKIEIIPDTFLAGSSTSISGNQCKNEVHLASVVVDDRWVFCYFPVKWESSHVISSERIYFVAEVSAKLKIQCSIRVPN
jgi:hypothetical protein